MANRQTALLRSRTGRSAVLSVILLEDDEVDAELLRRLLESVWPAAVNITTFTRLAELEHGIEDLDPDVVFCDLSVPDARGTEVVQRAVKCSAGAPVVVLTGSLDPDGPVLALENGAQDYLSKGSFDAETLARTLRYAIARASADKETRRIANDLVLLNDELDQYAGIVAHDLRAPIRTARLFTNRLTAAWRAGNDPTPVAAALDESLERMEFMIGGLLQMASLRDGALNLRHELLSTIVSEIESELLADIHANNVSIRCTRDGSILADQLLIRQLLRNLVENCIKYRSPDRDLVITLDTRRYGRATEITVTDNGIGIEPQYRARVFRLFERLDTSSRNTGLGLGLAFCRRVTDLHSGSISIDESPGVFGTTVCVTLPSEGVES